MALQAAITAHAIAGETLSALAWRVLGRDRGAVEKILAANPGLAALGPNLPEGTAVVIPTEADAATSGTARLVQLWD